MSLRRSFVAGLGLALLAPLAAPGVGSAAPTPDPVVTKAKTWLLTQQEADGGFEVANFAGFETSDATLALAEISQTTPGWSKPGALAAIQAQNAGSGKDPLDQLDDLVETGDQSTVAAAVRSAKVIALVAGPLGLDPTDFDPSSDSEAAVDLVAQINSHVEEGSLAFGTFFNGVLYTTIGFTEVGETLPANIADQILDAQRSDGSWNYAGTQDAEVDGDVDTTSAALLALKALGRDTGDEAVEDAIGFLASQQVASGAWQAFGSDDTNSTAVAVTALSALHVDVTTSTWRTTFGHPASGTYVSPIAWLKSQQNADGHINSPNDSFGVNTLATTQTLEALARQWFLAQEHAQVSAELAGALGSPAATPSSDAATTASDAIGSNVSIGSARRAGAAAVVTSTFGRKAAAADLFVQALGRTIDPSGSNYWSNKLLTITRPQMLSRLTGSSEYYRKHGNTNAAFVDSVYQAVLGRAADPGGKAYWVKKLDNGDSVLHVAQSLTKSNEFKRREVRLAYQRVLDRLPTSDELTAGLARVAGARVEALLADLAGSAEYYDQVTTSV